MSRVVTLYRTIARYRLDELLPASQRPKFFSLLLRIFPIAIIDHLFNLIGINGVMHF